MHAPVIITKHVGDIRDTTTVQNRSMVERRPHDGRPLDIMRVVVVRDATTMFRLMPRLTSRFIDIVVVSSSRGFVDKVVELHPHVVVVDIDSFATHAAAICRDLYQGVTCRVVGLADRLLLSEMAIVELLDAGADDVVTVSVATPVLHARLRVAARAAPRAVLDHRVLRVGDVVIDLDARSVHVAGRIVNLPPLHYELLVALASDAGTTIRTDDLMRQLWGGDTEELTTRRLRIAVSWLRKRLGSGPSRPAIDTVHRVGYRLIVTGVGARSGRPMTA